MSDKSFGDQTNRNIVKNPLLSSAVTGVSIDDLTNKAILLPVTPSQGVITRPDTTTLAHQPDPPHKHDPQKQKDDFDVNEYFARLQCTRYVSAPINTQIESLETEDLEEVNLQETEVPREQSLTSDIAQNFSQLPNVLPHVASAVFSSFSNMLSLKSRDPTPDERGKVEVQETVQDLAPPLKEPPIGGGGNFRIASKKKYAQIPGLSCGGSTGPYPPTNQPFPSTLDNTQSQKTNNESHINFFTPETSANVYPNIDQTFDPNANFAPDFAYQNVYSDTSNVGDIFGTNKANVGSDIVNQNVYTKSFNVGETFETMNANVGSSLYAPDSNMKVVKQTDAKEIEVNIFAVKDEFNSSAPVNLTFPTEHSKEIGANTLPPKEQFPPPSQSSQYLPNQGSTQVIPPPPMFSTRSDNQSAKKSVLPPSVARRISANHPVIKQQVSAPTVFDNIFVPTFDQTSTQSSVSQTFYPNLPPISQTQPSNPPSIFVPTFPVSSEKSEPTLPSSIQSNVESQTVLKPSEISSTIGPNLDSNLSMPSETKRTSQPESNVTMFNPESLISSEPQIAQIPLGTITKPPIYEPTMPPKSITSTTISDKPTIFTPTSPPKNPSASEPPIYKPSLPPQTSVPAVSILETSPGVQMYTPNTNVSISSSTAPSILTPVLPSSSTPVVSIPTSEQVPMDPVSLSYETTMFDLTKPMTSTGSAPSYEPAPPTFFNPLQYQNTLEQKVPESASDPKPLTEPPKSVGASNYRMTKKRPQYYSGPIEGVGAISNNVKPVIPSVDTGAFQGAVLAPEPSIQPFPVQSTETDPSQSPFDISKPFTQPEYNTPFDFSRQTTELYEQCPPPQRQESKTFGLIGSLKSKFSSIDINKIQNTVTTFFDPAYNEPKKEEPDVKEFMPFERQTMHQSSTQSNFEIFVPTIDQTNNPSYDYHNVNTGYYGQNQYYQQDAYNLYNQEQMNPVTSYFQDPNYQTGFNIGQQTSTDYTQPLTAKTDLQTQQDTSVPLIPVESEVPKGYGGSNIISQNAIFETIHSDKIEDINKTIDNTQKQVEAASQITSNIPMEIQRPPPNTSTFDLSAKSFFDSPITRDTTFKPTKSIDLLYATGDKAEKDSINKDLKTKINFYINDPSDRGEDKIFDEVLSSIIGEETLIGSVVPSKQEEEILKTSIEETKPLFPQLDDAYPKGFMNPLEVKKQEIFGQTNIETVSPEIKIRETNLLESLTTDAIPIVAVSSVPLFGLSTIIADNSKEHAKIDIKPVSLLEAPKDIFFDKNAGISFFEHNIPSSNLEDQNRVHTQLNRKMSQNLTDLATEIKSISLFDNQKEEEKVKSIFEEKTPSAPELLEEPVSELSICETCREFNKPEDKETEDLTTQLIENITSRIQLSNPVEALLTEGDSIENRTDFDSKQFAEIAHITEETIDTINVQSATELLDDEMKEMAPRNYGWCEPVEYPEKALSDHDYSFKLDPSSIGFFGNNSLFFDNVPNNASDEIKAEFKNSHEDMLTRQVSIPSAPPAEDDTKSDETGGLDVNSIEQDAKKDFPIYEEYVIEPSETDDDKIEYKEREKSEDPVPEIDSFTNRVEKFKKMEETVEPEEIFEKKCLFDMKPKNSPAISIASYFDTGNYAAETHYRNSLSSPSSSYQFGSPNIPMRIPPGFEDEYHRRMSGVSLQDKAEIEGLKLDVHYIPETSTQTPVIATTTYVSSQSDEIEVGFDIKSNLVSLVEDDSNTPIPVETVTENTDSTDKSIKEIKTDLPDPINFFSSEPSNLEAPETFNRLASYFSSPKEDKSFFDSNQNKTNINTTKPHKSFFELSQGQNHYIDRNMPDDKRAVLDVMRDLTSTQNIVVSKDQVVRTVNYFTVEYDKNTCEIPNQIKDVHDQTDDNFTSIIDCEFCFKDTLVNLIDGKYKVRQLMNDNTEGKRDSESMEPTNDPRRSVTLNMDSYSMHEDAKDGVNVVHENRSSSEYSPVKFHWFYSVEIDDKSIWRGFSISDSRALEEAYNSTDLNEYTLVATDGGRYDVNVTKRLRTAVYWTEKPTSVARCSWFYKGPTDARYVPYTEAVAEKLEEEYHHGMTTGEWHRRLLLPNNELVVMHGPSVMVHFLHSGTADTFSAPPLFAFGKRMYRNPPKIRVARDQPVRMDHLILLVHGAGEYRSQKEKIQSTSRPRVVRRGHDESEIEDTEPSSIDHLLLLCHGVGSACDMRFRSVEEVVDDFRATSLQLVQSHYKNSYDNGTVSRVEVLPISWHSTLHSGETGVDRRLAQITLDSIPRLRNFTNDTVLDVLFYTSPVYCQTIIDTVCSELNRIYNLFVTRNPTFKGRVSLGGHSLGSVILYDLLCHQPTEPQNGNLPDKKLVSGPAGTGQPCVKYPQLQFKPAAMYALGSPIAIFECIRGVEALGTEFALPTCDNFFNIFHPYDPIAYRIEPLIHPRLRDVKPSLIPHHKGRKRMHLELKDTMSRVGADLKQKLIESLRTTWNKWMSQPPTDGQLEKVVEEEMEKEQLCDETKEELEKQLATSGMSGKLNGGRRVDYVLQEAPLELINEYLFAMRSHVGYWESEDTMLLMLREIYDALGVQPDCTLPQQGMTVQRTKNLQDETIVIDHPSTSRGST